MSIADIITLLSGVALFLFGMTLMGDGLKHVSGDKLEPILFRLSNTPLKGILLGTGVTAVIQSSSATSVMVVGFVNSNMMKLRQAIFVILGSILGTSITGWVISLSYINGTSGITSLLSTATLTGIIAVVGIILRMFCKKQIHHHVGDIMMGFAVLMFGMSTMSGAVDGLGEQPWFTSLLTSLTNPLLGILIGILFAMVLQSASAAVGIVQALSVTGAMLFSSALPLLMGIAIGAAFPVLLSAVGANIEGKRAAFSYLAANFLGVLVLSILFYVLEGVCSFSFVERQMDPFSIALLNTIFRMIMVLLLAPFARLLEKLMGVLIPEKRKKAEEGTIIKLEDRFLPYPTLAIEQSRKAIDDMAEQASKAVTASIQLLDDFQPEGLQNVYDLEDLGDKYEDELGAYLLKLAKKELTDQQSRYASVYLHTISDFERLSDHARNIAQSAEEMHNKKLIFSDAAKHDMKIMSAAVQEIIHNTKEAFLREDSKLAKRVEPLEEVIDDLCDEMKMRHVDRLQSGECTIANGFVFNDLLTNFERMSDHCSNIAVAILEMQTESINAHEYLEKVKSKRSADFVHNYDYYRDKYSLQKTMPKAE